jgi:ectoine hydroxylase-related dioxygenase (phytanoyl-CoA dioxygenase family)
MLHRQLKLHERYMLHPRVLDVLEVIIGPDVLALQTMLFLKGPGKPGQGWHQDSYYIPTHPDTLCGAWIAIDDCDEQNGAMWFAKGSGVEPVYPPCPEVGYGFGDKLVGDIRYIKGASVTDNANNSLSTVVDKYDQVLVSARAGDVVFFNGHVLHRSKRNWSTDRFRRSFVSHYCNARGIHAMGRGFVRFSHRPDDRPRDEDDQQQPHPGTRRHAFAFRPAAFRHTVCRNIAGGIAKTAKRACRQSDRANGKRIAGVRLGGSEAPPRPS